ncbi:MAG: response regulator transcription factor, partial [Dehalococcoidia bacterium]|nr:response regulator transcription factor [Dehalococcoidia bacterium]
MVKIFLIDHHPVFRRGLASLLGGHTQFQVVGDAANVKEALPLLEELQPDIIIADFFSPNGDGYEGITMLNQKRPQVKVLVLTDSQNETDFLNCVRSGAKGYLMKKLDLPELVDSIRLVASGTAIVYSTATSTLLDGSGMQNRPRRNGTNGLSEREKEILSLVASGSSNKEIASKCYVSETTVKAHMRRITEKMNVKNRAQAVAIAMEKGLLHIQKPSLVALGIGLTGILAGFVS